MEFGFSLHDLRHAHATIKLENGASLEAVSKDLGHASSAITLGVYSHPLRKNQAASSEIWSRAMAGVMAEERKHLKDR
jgi:integrase